MTAVNARRVIFVLLDGLSARSARSCMGYLESLREAGRAFGGFVRCELPALSRPLYHCLITGLRPAESGLVHNTCWQAAPAQSCFHLAGAQGRITAAAAFYWFSEIVNAHPFAPERERVTADPTRPIRHGLFHSCDSYPDAQVFLDAQSLLTAHAPDLLLVHSLGIDHAGHLHGHDSPGYRNAAREADMLLARHMPGWLEQGYQLMITSDHGMNADKTHNGNSPEEREVPVWLVGEAFRPDALRPPEQTEWCGTICEVMKLKAHGKTFCREVLR
ncbi:MAG: alkaline phosphatase family protein [Desulfovibrionaceae bacterium]|nr:alkaline phosphatase family protein [Desulfovibrionaceae bacterium]